MSVNLSTILVLLLGTVSLVCFALPLVSNTNHQVPFEKYQTPWECEEKYLTALKICGEIVKGHWDKTSLSKELLDAMSKGDKVKAEEIQNNGMRCFFMLDLVKCYDDYTMVFIHANLCKGLIISIHSYLEKLQTRSKC